MSRLALVVALLALAASVAHADVASDALVHADATRAAGYVGSGVTVALLDTGVDDSNPDLAGAIVDEHCFVPPDGCPDGTAEEGGSGSAQDDQGHGTQMAEIIAGAGAQGPIGIAPGASIVSVKIADSNGRTSTEQVIDGLQWLIDNHPEVQVVNISLSSDTVFAGDCSNANSAYATVAALVDQLHSQGALVFAASGNLGSHTGLSFPACIGGVVAVGGVYTSDVGPFTEPSVCRDATTKADEIACFSDSDGQLDLLGAGALVDAGGPGPLAGTSTASAQAAGAAAVLFGADSTLGPDDVLGALQSTGVPITDPRNGVATPLIDLAAAVGNVTGTPVPPVSPPASVGGRSSVPRLGLSTLRISFARPGAKTLVVRNVGAGVLSVRAHSTLPSVTIAPLKLNVPAGGRASLTIRFRPAKRGAYRGRIVLTTDDPGVRTIVLPFSGKRS